MTEKEILCDLGLLVGPIVTEQQKNDQLEYFTDADGCLWGVRTDRPKPKGITYLKKWAFSINEGEGPANIHAKLGGNGFFFYVFWEKLRFYFRIGKPSYCYFGK